MKIHTMRYVSGRVDRIEWEASLVFETPRACNISDERSQTRRGRQAGREGKGRTGQKDGASLEIILVVPAFDHDCEVILRPEWKREASNVQDSHLYSSK